MAGSSGCWWHPLLQQPQCSALQVEVPLLSPQAERDSLSLHPPVETVRETSSAPPYDTVCCDNTQGKRGAHLGGRGFHFLGRTGRRVLLCPVVDYQRAYCVVVVVVLYTVLSRQLAEWQSLGLGVE